MLLRPLCVFITAFHALSAATSGPDAVGTVSDGTATGAAFSTIQVTRAGIDLLLATEPFLLLSDPRAATAAAHVARQFELLGASDNVPPFVDLLRQARSMEARLIAVPHPQRDRSDPALALRIDAGAAAATMAAYVPWVPYHTTDTAKPYRVGVITGQRHNEKFWGQAGSVSYLMTLDPIGWPDGPAWTPATALPPLMTSSTTALAPALARYASAAAIAPWCDRALPGFRAWTPAITALLSREGTTAIVTTQAHGVPGIDHALRPLSATRAALLRGEQMIAFGAAVDPDALMAWLALLIDVNAGNQAPDAEPLAAMEARFVEALGVPSSALTRILDGSIIVHGGWALTVVPQFAGVCGLAVPTAEAVPIISALAQHAKLPATKLAGAAAAWQAATPLGLITIAVAGDRLVIGNDETLLSDAIAGTRAAIPVAVPPAASVLLRVDAPGLARMFLPMAYSYLANQRESLGRDALRSLTWQTQHAMQQQRRQLGVDAPAPPPIPVSELLAEEIDGGLRQLFRTGDVAAQANAGLTILTEEIGFRVHLVHRSATATWSVHSNVKNQVDELDRTTVLARTAKLRRVAGPPVEDLAVIAVPETATFDRRWLPPLATILAHVPATWDLTLTPQADGLTLRERGLPLLSCFANAGAVAMVALPQELAVMERRAIRERGVAAARARHPAVFTALAKAQLALRKQRTPPAKASDLIGPDFTLLDAAGLLHGVAPADKTVLDRLGTWTPDEATTWTIPLDGDWAALLRNWGDIDVEPGHPNLPRPAATPADPQSLF